MNDTRGKIHLEKTSVSLNGRTILHDVSFLADASEVHCVIGPNGSGKSTLLRVLSGDIPVEGLTLAGTNMKHLSTVERARLRSVMRTSVRPDFPYSVFDVVSWALLGTTTSKQEDVSQQVNNALTQLGIADLAQRPVNQLSTGQLTKVNIASVLLQGAGIILADEPEAALDPVARVDAWTQLASRKFTTIIATHSLDLVQKFATHVTAIKSGEIVYSCAAKELSLDDLLAAYRN